MAHNAGDQAAARELMCDDKALYMAFRRAGQPCAFRPEWEAPGTQPPMVQRAPTPIAPPPPQQVIVKDRTNLPRCKGPNDQGPCYSG